MRRRDFMTTARWLREIEAKPPVYSDVMRSRNTGAPPASGMRPSVPSEYRAARRRSGRNCRKRTVSPRGQPNFGGARGAQPLDDPRLVLRSRSTIDPSAAAKAISRWSGETAEAGVLAPWAEIASAFPSNRKVQAPSPVCPSASHVWDRTPFAWGKRYETLPRDESSDRTGGGCRDQTRTDASFPAVTANRPSREQATDQTVVACAGVAHRNSSRLASHARSRPSSPAARQHAVRAGNVGHAAKLTDRVRVSCNQPTGSRLVLNNGTIGESDCNPPVVRGECHRCRSVLHCVNDPLPTRFRAREVPDLNVAVVTGRRGEPAVTR